MYDRTMNVVNFRDYMEMRTERNDSSSSDLSCDTTELHNLGSYLLSKPKSCKASSSSYDEFNCGFRARLRKQRKEFQLEERRRRIKKVFEALKWLLIVMTVIEMYVLALLAYVELGSNDNRWVTNSGYALLDAIARDVVRRSPSSRLRHETEVIISTRLVLCLVHVVALLRQYKGLMIVFVVMVSILNIHSMMADNICFAFVVVTYRFLIVLLSIFFIYEASCLKKTRCTKIEGNLWL